MSALPLQFRASGFGGQIHHGIGTRTRRLHHLVCHVGNTAQVSQIQGLRRI